MVNSFVYLVHFKSMCIWMIHQLKLTYTEYRFGLKGQAIYSSQSSRWRLSGSRLIRNTETSGWITSEMLTSGKLKSGDFFFDQHLPPKWICQLCPPPPKKNSFRSPTITRVDRLFFITGFLWVLENLDSPGILFWHFPGLSSPGNLLHSSN